MRVALYSSLWLLNMILLSQSGPMGREPVVFVCSYIFGFMLMIMLLRSWPTRLCLWQSVLIIVTLGIIGRLAFLLYPVSNDVYRYIWEGYIQNHGFNPYLTAPDHHSLQGVIHGEMAEIWQGINHKDLTAIYPPFTMVLFRGLAAISPSPLVIKVAMFCFDMLIVAILILFIRLKSLPSQRLILYCMNPFVIVFAVGEAHVDVMYTGLFVVGLYCFCRSRSMAGFFFLGCAVMSKYLALIALPFVVKRSNIHALPVLLVPALFTFPYLDDVSGLFSSLLIFGGSMHYNDGIGELVRFVAGGWTPAILAVILSLVCVIIYLGEHDILRSVYFAVAAMLLLLPTLHPWYLLIIAPFMVLYPSKPWLYLMLAVMATMPVMAIEYQTGVFQEIKWLKLIEYVPFFCLLLLEIKQRQRQSEQICFSPVNTVSVVIPTLNEADHIERAISSLREHQLIKEIIVVDGRSEDTTRKIAQELGAKVLESQPGRGYQIHKGIQHTSADVALILHADTFLKSDAIERMVESLNANRNAPGGAFGMDFKGNSVKLRAISLLNNMRAQWFGISFGDQAQFIRLDALDEIGGYPAMMLMEDVELAMRMKKIAHPLFIRRGAKVSQRGWLNRRFTTKVWLVLWLVFTFLVKRRFYDGKAINTNNYYASYYRNG